VEQTLNPPNESARLNAAFLVNSPPLYTPCRDAHIPESVCFPYRRKWRPLKALFILHPHSQVTLRVTFLLRQNDQSQCGPLYVIMFCFSLCFSQLMIKPIYLLAIPIFNVLFIWSFYFPFVPSDIKRPTVVKTCWNLALCVRVYTFIVFLTFGPLIYFIWRHHEVTDGT